MTRRGLSTTISMQSLYLKDYGPANAAGLRPFMQNDAWLAPTGTVKGDVFLSDEVSVWYNASVDGEHHKITIGRVSNVRLSCRCRVTLFTTKKI